MLETQLYSWTENGIYYQIKRLSEEVSEGEVIYLEGQVKCSYNSLDKSIRSLLCVQDYAQVGEHIKIVSRGDEDIIRMRLIDVMTTDADWLRNKYHVNQNGKQSTTKQDIQPASRSL